MSDYDVQTQRIASGGQGTRNDGGPSFPVFASFHDTRSNLETMEKQFYVYIMTNARHSALYTGVTSDIQARVYQHKEKLNKGFTSRYNINMLVYYEEWAEAYPAIAREKHIKGGSRQDKIDLINKMNPGWCYLYERL